MKPIRLFIIFFFLLITFIESNERDFEYVRIDPDNFSTKVYLLYSEKMDTAVILVGVVHIGEPEYYKTIQVILDGCSQVYYEGIQLNDPMMAGKPKVSSQPSMYDFSFYHTLFLDESLEHLNETQSKYAEALELVHQSQIIQPRSHWENADISARELRDSMELLSDMDLSIDKNSLDQETSLIKGFYTSKETKRNRIMHNRRELAKEILQSANQINQEEDYKEALELLVKKRNQVVIQKLKETQGRFRTVGILYGAAHIPSFLEILHGSLGFRRASDLWLTAWRLN